MTLATHGGGVIRRPVLALVLALLFVSAGCSQAPEGTPTPGAETNASISVENAGDQPFTAEVTLVPGRLTRVNIQTADGVSQPVDNLSAVRGVYAFAWRNVTSVSLPPGVEPGASTRFQLGPGDSAETRLFAPTGETTLLVVIRRGDRVAAWATVYCGSENSVERLTVSASAGDPGRFGTVTLQCTQR